MIWTPAVILVALAASEAAARPHTQREETYGIEWTSCGPEIDKLATGSVQCANISVPLDYTDEENGETHTIELIKAPAEEQPAAGNIIFNFGGPGAEGIFNMAGSVHVYQPATGGKHDLISFNPRGTSKEFLEFSCYASQEERDEATDPTEYAEASDASLGRLWASGKVLADTCAENAGDKGQLMSSAFVARDIVKISEALGDEDVSFFGMSYGTALGATLAAMFPDRINRMVLDGVLNPTEYYKIAWDWETMADVDAALKAFLDLCFEEGPEKCALAHDGSTPEDTENAIYDLLETIKTEPIPLPPSLAVYNSSFAGKTIDHSSVRALIHGTLYHPANFPLLAAGLDSLLHGNNLTAFATWRDVEGKILGSVVQSESQIGVRCGDKDPSTRFDDIETMGRIVEEAEGVSKLGGVGLYVYNCAQWAIETKERYEGGFEVKTKNPILLMSSTWDPVTPLRSAFNASSGFEGSVVLERTGFGHLALAQASKCLNEAMGTYYNDGTLPEEGTKCEPDEPIFV